MCYPKEKISELLGILKEVERELQYQGLNDYVQNLKRKEKFILQGSTAYLRRLQADRRSRSLGLVEFVPFDERQDRYVGVTVKSDYRAVGLFMIGRET